MSPRLRGYNQAWFVNHKLFKYSRRRYNQTTKSALSAPVFCLLAQISLWPSPLTVFQLNFSKNKTVTLLSSSNYMKSVTWTSGATKSMTSYSSCGIRPLPVKPFTCRRYAWLWKPLYNQWSIQLLTMIGEPSGTLTCTTSVYSTRRPARDIAEYTTHLSHLQLSLIATSTSRSTSGGTFPSLACARYSLKAFQPIPSKCQSKASESEPISL